MLFIPAHLEALDLSLDIAVYVSTASITLSERCKNP